MFALLIDGSAGRNPATKKPPRQRFVALPVAVPKTVIGTRVTLAFVATGR